MTGLSGLHQGFKEEHKNKVEEEGEDLVTASSLAYVAKILLNTVTLHLKRGHRYGENGTRNSTLVRAIANGQAKAFVLRMKSILSSSSSAVKDLGHKHAYQHPRTLK